MFITQWMQWLSYPTQFVTFTQKVSNSIKIYKELLTFCAKVTPYAFPTHIETQSMNTAVPPPPPLPFMVDGHIMFPQFLCVYVQMCVCYQNLVRSITLLFQDGLLGRNVYHHNDVLTARTRSLAPRSRSHLEVKVQKSGLFFMCSP